ncbi:MAG: hypothetical protein KDA24_30280, partial [Deltaproteobacteria bacterium]|nr:hypothetical protein [Deltaproteobacteria bacterium]
MSAIKENPILFGCLGLLGLLSLLACSGVVATYFLADEIVEKATEKMEELGEEAGKQAGLKDPFSTVPELLSKGWALSIHVQNEAEVEFTLVPQQDATVDCALLQGVLFPYLAGTKETVIVKSENRVVSEDGTVTTTPVECRWSGFPGAQGVGIPVPVPPAAPVEG